MKNVNNQRNSNSFKLDILSLSISPLEKKNCWIASVFAYSAEKYTYIHLYEKRKYSNGILCVHATGFWEKAIEGKKIKQRKREPKWNHADDWDEVTYSPLCAPTYMYRVLRTVYIVTIVMRSTLHLLEDAHEVYAYKFYVE